jgi:hypothetical protein
MHTISPGRQEGILRLYRFNFLINPWRLRAILTVKKSLCISVRTSASGLVLNSEAKPM